MTSFGRKKEICLLCLNILVCNDVLVHSTSLSSCDSVDPCSTANATMPYEPYARSENCPYESAYAPCDRYITPMWYRFDDDLLTHCPGLLSCGAIYPCWMNDSLPSSSDGVVTKTVCKVGFQDCCIKEYSIKIKHCGSYYAYCLPGLDGCPERFCFGSNGTCDYPSTQISVTTESVSTISKTTSSKDTGPAGWLIGVILVLVMLPIAAAFVAIIIFKIKKNRGKMKSFLNLRVDTSVQVDPNKDSLFEAKRFSRGSKSTTPETNNNKGMVSNHVNNNLQVRD